MSYTGRIALPRFASKLGLGKLERESTQPAQVVARARQLNAVVDSVMEDWHRPATLDRVGLVPARQQFVSSFERVNGLQAQFAALGLDGVRLAPDVEITLYRVVQESLTNVARHAHAQRGWMCFCGATVDGLRA